MPDASPLKPTRPRALSLGKGNVLGAAGADQNVRLPAHHLVTHGVVVGMTGSGKTGLVTVLAEEALRSEVPVLVIDVKGDLPNLLFAFPSFGTADFLPYVGAMRAPGDTRTDEAMAADFAAARARGLTESGLSEATLRAFRARTDIRVITPGSNVGEPLHVLSSLERRSTRWDTDAEGARASLDTAVSLVLRLLGREDDPVKSREHVLLATLAARRLAAGEDADLAALMADLEAPPMQRIGALDVDAYVPPAERHELAASLNSLLASSSLARWREGATLNVGEWLAPKEGRTQAVIVSVAHLDDEARALVLGLLLEEVLAWVRTLAGAQHLRALVLFDEVYGFLPPHPANPPTKRPIVALMKQARAFGVGVVLATQNPMDLDYRALGNAGLWCVGRLQTDADRARVVEGMTGARVRGHGEGEAARLTDVIKALPQRTFVLRDAHEEALLRLVPRYAMSWLRGPMTREELARASGRDTCRGDESRVR